MSTTIAFTQQERRRMMISGRLKEPILVEGLTPEQIKHLAFVMGIGSDEFTTVSCAPNEFNKYTGTRWIALVTFPKKPGLTQIGVCIRETDRYNPMPQVVHDLYTTTQDNKIISRCKFSVDKKVR